MPECCHAQAQGATAALPPNSFCNTFIDTVVALPSTFLSSQGKVMNYIRRLSGISPPVRSWYAATCEAPFLSSYIASTWSFTACSPCWKRSTQPLARCARPSTRSWRPDWLDTFARPWQLRWRMSCWMADLTGEIPPPHTQLIFVHCGTKR